MACNARNDRGFGVLECRGVIKLGESAREFSAHAIALVRSDVKGIVVDLAGVSYIDSTGFGEFVGLFAACMKAEKVFALAALNQRLRGLLAVTELRSVFPVFVTADEAIEQLLSLTFAEYIRRTPEWVSHGEPATKSASI